ncbi:MAG TPA: helix-turn-helix domain-containing protein, partial [Pirellulales bacterium]
MAERLSLSEVSRLLKISPAELRTKCEAGEIAGAERAGGHWFFPSGIVKDVANEFGVPLLDDLPLAIEPPSADDFSKMEISTANLDGGIPDPFGDPGRKSSEPASGGADVLFGDLQESDDDRNDMRTVMGSAAELASRVEDEIRLETPKDETAEDTAVLSGELDADESNDPNDMRTMMGSAHQLGGDEQIGLHSEASGEFGSPFAGGPAKGNSFEGPDDDDAAVLGGELEPASGDMGTLMGSAGQFGLGRGPGEQIRLDAKSEDVTPSRGEHFTLGEDDAPAEDDADAAVLSGELETDADDASNDMRTMMGGAAQFGLGGGDPIDLNARQEEPSSAHEAFSLSEAEDEGTGDGGGMRTMVGDAASIGFDADQVRLDLSNREDLSGGSSIDKTPAQALEDSDDVALGGGMHTMVGDVSALGFDAARVQLEQEGGSSLAERASDDAAVLSGDLDVDDSNEMGTVMRSAADLAAEGSGEVRLAAGTSGGSSIDDDAAVLSGDLEVDDSGDMRTVMGGAGQFGFGSTAPIGLSGDDEEASAMDANFDEPAAGETGGMRTMVGDAASIGFNADQVRLDLSGRDELA